MRRRGKYSVIRWDCRRYVFSDTSAYFFVLADTQKGVDFGHFFFEFIAVLFNETPRRDKFFAPPDGFMPRHFEYCFYRFFSRAFDKRASIYDYHVRFGVVGNNDVISVGQVPEHFFCIDAVLVAAERYHRYLFTHSPLRSTL